ncbi:Crp/Fnr family transcriptional regulator [Kibdelosporangium lantanae]|uniref:Crp/Fnr family transcriptional regulator n=1 Tax=Kibdelosporangium lantanae TaxID=1497396 RepID=A0ABW3M1J2_9PSEU
MQDDTSHVTKVLTEGQLRALESLGTHVHFPAGDTIFREGQPSRSVVVVRSGLVKITKRGPDGVEVVLATRGPGEVLGDEGVLVRQPRSATITTVTALEGVDVSADDLRAFVEQEKLWPQLYAVATQRRRESDRKTLVARLDVRGRLVNLLLEQVLSAGHLEGDDWVIENAFSQQEIADSIGASRDAVAVELRKLREEGLLTTARRRFVLHDIEALRNISPS